MNRHTNEEVNEGHNTQLFSQHTDIDKAIVLQNADIVTPSKIIHNGSVVIADGEIKSISTKPSDLKKAIKNIDRYRYKILDLDLEGKKYIFPGLINAHEHLGAQYYHIDLNQTFTNTYDWLSTVFNLNKFPYNLLYRPYIYLNYPFDLLGRLNLDPHDIEIIMGARADSKKVKMLSLQTLYQCSTFRNLISGVTTIADYHSWHNFKLAIRLVRNQIVINSVRWQKFLIPYGYKLTKGRVPFVIDCECGTDEDTKRELVELNELGALGSNTVLIHGVGFSKKDIKLVAERGASVVWCPCANVFTMNRTANIPELLKHNVNIALGTDGTDSGAINLLNELRGAKRIYRDHFGDDIDSKILTYMVTVNAAKAFKLDTKLGSIERGKIADLLMFPRKSDNPYDDLVNLHEGKIDLVIHNGVPIYGNPTYMNRFIKEQKYGGEETYMKIDIRNNTKLIKNSCNCLKQIMSHIELGRLPPFVHPFEVYSNISK